MISYALLGALALAPTIREMSPPGAERGKTVKIVLRGEGLTNTAKILSEIPGTITKLTGEDFAFLVDIKPDAAVGLYPIRLLNEDGLSNLMLFSVGRLPETIETKETREKTNNTRDSAQSIATPITVNGTLDGPDIDYYAIDVRAPRKLVVEIDARRAGSALDPAFEIEDATGKVIAKADDSPGCGVDARAQVTFAKPGRYYVRVHDSKYSDQAMNFYRLKIGEWTYADSMYPIGAPRGSQAVVTLMGGNLAKPTAAKVNVPEAAVAAPVTLEGSASLPLTLIAAEPDWKDAKFAKAKTPATFPLAVNPGESWVVEAVGRAAGATLADPIVTVFGPDKKKIAGRLDFASPHQAVPFTVPEGVTEVTVAIEELLGRAGDEYGYRYRISKAPADFVASVGAPFVNVPAGGTAIVPLIVERRGYDGPVKITISDIPPGIRVAGGNIPSEAAAQIFNDINAGFRTSRGMITLTAAPDIAPQQTQLKLVAVAETPQGRIVKDVRGPGVNVGVRGLRQSAVTAPWLGMRLPFATARPLPVAISNASPQVRIAQGFEFPLAYRVTRRQGAMAVSRVRDQQINAVGNLRFLAGEPGKNPDSGSVLLSTNFASPVTTFDTVLVADTQVDGKMQTIYSPIIEIDIVAGYQVHPLEKRLTAKPGAAFSIPGTVFREPTFEGGLVRIQVGELPEGVDCDASEAAAEAREFRLNCRAAATAKPGKYEILLTSVAPETGRKAKADYKGPEVPLTLILGN